MLGLIDVLTYDYEVIRFRSVTGGERCAIRLSPDGVLSRS